MEHTYLDSLRNDRSTEQLLHLMSTLMVIHNIFIEVADRGGKTRLKDDGYGVRTHVPDHSHLARTVAAQWILTWPDLGLGKLGSCQGASTTRGPPQPVGLHICLVTIYTGY